MTVDYQFTSFPTRSVTTTASDGRFRVAVSLPVEDVAPGDWKHFEGAGFANPELFINAHTRLKEKLTHSLSILEGALRQINTSTTALDSGTGFIAFGYNEVEELKSRQGTLSKIRKYRTVLRSFSNFLTSQGTSDVRLVELDHTIIDSYNRSLADRGVMATTIGFYNRILHAIYTQAVRRHLTPDMRPFRNAEMNGMRIAPTHDRVLAPEDLHRLFTADLSDTPDLAQARDILRVAYETGLTFARIVTLRHSDLTPQLSALLTTSPLYPPLRPGKPTPSPSAEASPSSPEEDAANSPAKDASTVFPSPAPNTENYLFYPEAPGTAPEPQSRRIARLRADFSRAQQLLSTRLSLTGLLSIPRIRSLSSKKRG